ncbi:TIGR04149 family rSAM-modified RiPP [uncultured Mediterranea sp.]|uniref:TIGR04149 family rSAM-modified RiPP n=1 Tax=uncultured Mediterranea sp. TaxID=1926662 RepID=UPI0027D9BB2E|nr:TIGR04149 family rSAM-modified RiPP [uncultured Mediterranea sp.]
MKEINKKIKLTQLNKVVLSEKELNRLLGGEEEKCCICHDRGSATIYENHDANLEGGTSGLVPGDGGGGWAAGAFKDPTPSGNPRS